MTHNDYTYKELLQFGWEKTKEHFGFLISVLIGTFFIGFIVGWIPVLGDIVSGLITIAVLSALFVIIHGHTPHYSDLMKPFKTYKVTLNYFIGLILYILAVLAGLILLILPGIYVSVRLQFFMYLVVEDENITAIDALKKSWAMTEGKFWNLFGFGLVFVGVNLLGLLALGVGLLFTIPATSIAYTELYRRLAQNHSHHHHKEHHVHGHLAA